MTRQAAILNIPQRQPRIGELVQIRSPRWLVEEIIEPTIPQQTCLVRLSGADDDAQGQLIEALWDYEIDRLILEEERWTDLAANGFAVPVDINRTNAIMCRDRHLRGRSALN